MYGDKAAELLSIYPATTDAEAMRQAEQIGRNSGFTLAARAWARAQTRTGKQAAYLYLLSRVQPFTPGVTFSDFTPESAGAYHMGDVPYWLGTYDAFNLFRRTRDWTSWDRELSNDMQDVIVTFARTNHPSTRAVQFTAYAPDNETRVDFGDAITVERLNTKGMDFLETTPAAPSGTGRGGRGRGGRGGRSSK
jgi:para-nitrobenzyl esterase